MATKFVRHLGNAIQRANFSSATTPGLSYVHCPSKESLTMTTFGQLLRNRTETVPDQDLFVFPSDNVRKTYSQFFAEVNDFASGLVALGLQPGDRVGIWAPNCFEWVLTQFACGLAGFVLVNINPAYQPREIEFCLNKVRVKALITIEKFKTQDYPELLFNLVPELANSKPGTLHGQRAPHLRHIIVAGDKTHSGMWKLSDVFGAGDSEAQKKLAEFSARIQPDQPHNIQFTSKAKILCCPPPLFHCIGSVLGSLSMLAHGGTCVFPSRSFDPLACLKAIDKEKCTMFCGTPVMYIDLLHHPEFKRYNMSSLRAAVSELHCDPGFIGGAPCPVEVCNAAIEQLNMKESFAIAYGTTENSPVTFATFFTDPKEKVVTTVGFPLENTEAKVIDSEGLTVPHGTVGELCTRGYMVMLGYYEDEAKTKEAIGADRWYRTGDLAVMLPDGYCRIVGRAKDLVIRGGENVYPVEVEDFLYTHPAVEDVQVVGVPDARMGEELCAWIRFKADQQTTEDELKAFCKGKFARYKVPRYFLFKEAKDYPLTPSGKVQKFKIKEMAKKELGL